MTLGFIISIQEKGIVDIKWKIKKIEHPLQVDHFNCGLFFIHFIKNFLFQNSKNKITFDCSPVSLECDRQLISTAIENYKKM